MSLSRYSAMLTASLLATACASTTSQAPLSGRWQADDSKVQLQLKDGKLSASAGCNRLFGPATVEGGRLVVGNLAGTMMMCAPEEMAAEDALKKLLASRPQIEQKDGRLLLKGDGRTLTLNAMPALDGGKTRFIYVQGKTAPCVGVAPMQCLQVREDKNAPWQHHYGQIEGFTPEAGLNYRLRIKEFDVANPPADAPSRRWVLDMVVESEVVKP